MKLTNFKKGDSEHQRFRIYLST